MFLEIKDAAFIKIRPEPRRVRGVDRLSYQ